MELENPVSHEEQGLNTATGVPPFCRKHVLVWAGFFFGWIVVNLVLPLILGNLRSLVVNELLIGLVASAVLTGGIVLFSSLRKRESLMQHPGHWFVFISATWFCLIPILSPIEQSDLIPNQLLPGFLGLSSRSLITIWLFGFIVFAAIRNDGIWRWVFAVCMAFYLPVVFSGVSSVLAVPVLAVPVLRLFAWFLPIFAIVVFLVGVVEMVNDHVRRDWVHWLGVVSFFLIVSASDWSWLRISIDLKP